MTRSCALIIGAILVVACSSNEDGGSAASVAPTTSTVATTTTASADEVAVPAGPIVYEHLVGADVEETDLYSVDP